MGGIAASANGSPWQAHAGCRARRRSGAIRSPRVRAGSPRRTHAGDAGKDRKLRPRRGALATRCRRPRRMIAAGGGGPAHVLGSSSGAIVALDLLARRPDAVRTLVAHEPPVVTLLPDGADWLARLDHVHATYLASGLAAAIAEFGAVVG